MEPVVKADAYGHGAIPISLALQAAGADGLSVATLDEAFELRAAGITIPLLVLYPVPPEAVAAAAQASITVSIGSGEPSLAMLRAAAGLHPPLEVHLEIETGLGRGGVLPGEAQAALVAIDEADGVRLAGVWSHLAAADDPGNALGQDARFADVLRHVDAVAWESGAAALRRHLAGSGGVLGGDVTRWDAVRTGIAIYGLVPDALVPSASNRAHAERLRPVMALKARPVRVVDLPAGHGVSYGPSYVTSRPTRVATLPLGYGDGWRRALSDRAEALVRGVRVPLVGRVSMDAVMADVTDVPGAPVTADDEFVLLGEQGVERITAVDLAATCGTISYEVVTAMSRRLARVYHAAGRVVGARTLTGGRSG